MHDTLVMILHLFWLAIMDTNMLFNCGKSLPTSIFKGTFQGTKSLSAFQSISDICCTNSPIVKLQSSFQPQSKASSSLVWDSTPTNIQGCQKKRPVFQVFFQLTNGATSVDQKKILLLTPTVVNQGKTQSHENAEKVREKDTNLALELLLHYTTIQNL